MRHPRRGNGSALPPNNGDDRRDMVGYGDCGIHGIYMGFTAICGGKAEPLPLRVGNENTNATSV